MKEKYVPHAGDHRSLETMKNQVKFVEIVVE